MSSQTVYVGMIGDLLHAGHLSVLEKARELGRVIVGVLTDQAVVSCNGLALSSFAARKALVESVSGVSMVVPQETHSYRQNLERYRPAYLVHGDDWCNGSQAAVRQEAIKVLSEWGGKLVEVPCTAELREDGPSSRFGAQRFRRLLEAKRLLRIIEVHDAISARIAENATASGRAFDGFWSSSLIDSTVRGRPDIEVVDLKSRLDLLEEIMDCTSKPIIYDGDSGGNLDQAFYLARTLSRTGVAALCLEDKAGRKRNSLYGRTAKSTQTSIKDFCERLRAVKHGVGASQLVVIARIESLVLHSDCDQAMERALAYCEAGADAILIHSVADSPREIFEFSRRFRSVKPLVPLIAVPTAFDDVTASELEVNAFNVVIYANHLMRAASSAMTRAANDILAGDRGGAIRQYSATPKDLLSFFPEPEF